MKEMELNAGASMRVEDLAVTVTLPNSPSRITRRPRPERSSATIAVRHDDAADIDNYLTPPTQVAVRNDDSRCSGAGRARRAPHHWNTIENLRDGRFTFPGPLLHLGWQRLKQFRRTSDAPPHGSGTDHQEALIGHEGTDLDGDRCQGP